MIKKLILLSLLSTIIFAKQHTLKYDVSFGIFSTIGNITSYYKQTGNRYEIEAVIRTTGLASRLSGGMVEKYKSKGSIVNGKLVPEIFIKEKKSSKIEKKRVFRFDHTNKIVYRKKLNKSEKRYDFYASNDILTLFVNSSETIINSPKGNLLRFYAIGSSKNDGLITVQKRGDGKFAVVINQDIFSSKKGELVVDIQKSGIWEKAVLKDVMLYGDITGKLKQ
ncbi:MAG: hypothetical protein B1H07_00895 [Campylobacteraceae bacterium 4484_166]|nr:MAG: hypothetical protein B1H07_00895 [Campylobacteraceae bacterium 4484_166]